MFISPTTIDRIREEPLHLAIGHYVTLKKKGVAYVGISPFNAEKTPSFNVHPTKGFWKDFSSGKGGRDVIGFLMQKENLDFVEATKMAPQDLSIEVKFENNERAQAWHQQVEAKKQLQPVMDWALSEFQKNEIPQEFIKRFAEKALIPFRIGYCTGLLDEARRTGMDLQQLFKAGLVGSKNVGEYYERFAGRVMFPLFDWRGHLTGFSGRSIKEGDKIKYLHTTGMEKTKELYGIQLAAAPMQAEGKCYVVEGPTDVIRFHEYKIPNTVGKQGGDFSEEQARIIKRYCTTVVFVPDADNAGMKSMEANAATAIKNGLVVKVVFPGKKN